MDQARMGYCYIIESKKLNRYYVGSCQGNLEERIRKHNDHSYGLHRYTAKASDWELFHCIECADYKMALSIEKHIKKMKSRVYIENLVKYPEMIVNLKLKYKST